MYILCRSMLLLKRSIVNVKRKPKEKRRSKNKQRNEIKIKGNKLRSEKNVCKVSSGQANKVDKNKKTKRIKNKE